MEGQAAPDDQAGTPGFYAMREAAAEAHRAALEGR